MLTALADKDPLFLSFPVFQDNPQTAAPSPPLTKGEFFHCSCWGDFGEPPTELFDNALPRSYVEHLDGQFRCWFPQIL